MAAADLSFEGESEQVLCQVAECFVYKIPTMASMSGHKAQGWDLNSFLWSGRCTVKSQGDKCIIQLTDKEDGTLFAEAPYDSGTVQPVTDSSRYFVLKITDPSGRHAFVGLGFTERNEAFEFNAALADHQRYVAEAKAAAERQREYASRPKEDLSLGDEQITVSIGGSTGSGRRRPAATASSGDGFAGLSLPPPPGGGRATTGAAAPAAPAAAPATAAAAAPQTAGAAAAADPFAGFGDFTSFTGASSSSSSSSSSSTSGGAASSSSSTGSGGAPQGWVAF